MPANMVICQAELSGPIGRPLSGRGIENMFSQPQRFGSRFDVFVDVDVFKSALDVHAQWRLQLNAFAFTLAAHVGQALRFAWINGQIVGARIFANDHSGINILLRPDEQSAARLDAIERIRDRKSTRLNSSHLGISYAVFCLKKKKNNKNIK